MIFIIGAIALLTAVTAIPFARTLFTRPLSRLAGQLHLIEKFELEAVEHRPALLAELDDFSFALNECRVAFPPLHALCPSRSFVRLSMAASSPVQAVN